MLAFLKADPRMDNLRSDPRYVQILKQMNFPVKSVFS